MDQTKEPGPPLPPSPLALRGWRLALLLLVLASMLLAFSLTLLLPDDLALEEEVVTVTQLMEDPETYLDRELGVKGYVVIDGMDPANSTFLLSDDMRGAKAPVLEVHMDEFPSQLRRGKQVIVVGSVEPGPQLNATKIIIGHSTEY